uniref:Uncharacterized protein n=1 Tax=Cyprinus carpio TaxID=7962 RepID=A0A8C2JQW5_CYPCA
MGGHDAGSQHQFTGIAKYLNSYNITARRNMSTLHCSLSIQLYTAYTLSLIIRVDVFGGLHIRFSRTFSPLESMVTALRFK